MDKLDTLLKTNRISRDEYLIYVIFETNELGKELLKTFIDLAVMNNVGKPTNAVFAWHDGRLSVFRDIKKIIFEINKKIEELSNE